MKVFQDLDVVELISNPLKVSPDSEYSQALLSCNAKELLCKFPALKEKFWDEKDGPKFKLFEKWWKAHKRTHKRREKREASAASTSRQVRFNMDPNMPNKNRNAARGSNNSRTPGKTHNEPSTPAPTAFGNCGNNRNTRPHNRAPSSARHGTHAPAPTTPAPTRRNRGAPRSTAAAPSTPKELSPHYAAELAVFGNLLKTAEKTGKEWREKNDRTEANESALLQSVSSQFTEWSTSARKIRAENNTNNTDSWMAQVAVEDHEKSFVDDNEEQQSHKKDEEEEQASDDSMAYLSADEYEYDGGYDNKEDDAVDDEVDKKPSPQRNFQKPRPKAARTISRPEDSDAEESDDEFFNGIVLNEPTKEDEQRMPKASPKTTGEESGDEPSGELPKKNKYRRRSKFEKDTSKSFVNKDASEDEEDNLTSASTNNKNKKKKPSASKKKKSSSASKVNEATPTMTLRRNTRHTAAATTNTGADRLSNLTSGVNSGSTAGFTQGMDEGAEANVENVEPNIPPRPNRGRRVRDANARGADEDRPAKTKRLNADERAAARQRAKKVMRKQNEMN